MIIRANGLENLINLLSRTYTDNKPEKMGKSERIRRGGLIIRILDLMLRKMDKKYDRCEGEDRAVYPVSQVRAFCEAKAHMAAIVQVLLVDNPELRKKTMKFIGNYFVSPSIALKETGIVDFLLMCVDDKTGPEALGLLYRIQAVNEDYNKDIDFSRLSSADRELISTNDKIMNSIFLRYFPVPFVKYMTEEPNTEQILKVYLSDSIEEPALIWSKDMRTLLIHTLDTHIAGFRQQLAQFVGNKTPNFRKVANMPTYPELFREVVRYPQIAREIRCAEYYLRLWNVNKGKMENIHQIVFFNNLEKTFAEVTASFPTLDLEDFKTVLRSYTLSYAKYFSTLSCIVSTRRERSRATRCC